MNTGEVNSTNEGHNNMAEKQQIKTLIHQQHLKEALHQE
jgi:hypothetical protein